MTLRNFRYALLAGLVIFTAITISSELRGFRSGDYGRLYRREISKVPEAAVRPPEIVTEAEPVDDQISADPFALQAAAREQYLLDERAAALATVPPASVGTITPMRTTSMQRGRIHIVQGADGVVVAQETPTETPKLRGGFMR